MSERKRVQAYLDKWTGQGTNPENGCHITYGELASHEDRGSCRAVYGWEIFIGDHQAGEVPNTVSYPGSSETLYPYRSDECFTAAARILKLDNPWRLTSEELPEEGRELLCEWNDGSRIDKAVITYSREYWLDLGAEFDEDGFPSPADTNKPPFRWMYVPE